MARKKKAEQDSWTFEVDWEELNQLVAQALISKHNLEGRYNSAAILTTNSVEGFQSFKVTLRKVGA